MKRYVRLAYWANAASFVLGLTTMVLMIITQHRFDPYLPALLFLSLAVLIVSALYISWKPKMTAEQKKKWRVGTVKFYRELGFFSEYGDLPDEKLASKLNSLYRKKTGDSIDPTVPSEEIAEFELLSLDESRFWMSELETDIFPGEKYYADLVEKLGKISRGVFNPTDITETWESEKGPIHVEFTANGVRHCLQPKYDRDWLDTDFLIKMEDFFKGTGYELVIHMDDPIAAMVLTPDEKKKIRRRRGPIRGGPRWPEINLWGR